MQFKSHIADFILYKNGDNGDTPYIHIKYSNDGGVTFTSNNGEDTGDYLGIYVDFIEADSIDPDSYKWSKVKGEIGPTGTSVDSVAIQYYLSTSKTELVNGSWVTTMPEWVIGTYLWVRYEIIYKDPVSTSYTEPLCDTSWETITGLESRVTVTETSITETNEAIKLLATKKEMETAISEVDTRLSSAETSIKLNADAIESKASTSDVDALTSRIITAESKITQNAESISLEIITRTEATNELEARTDTLETLATTTDTNFNDWANQYSKYFTFTDNGLVISSGNSTITLTIDNEKGIIFSKNDTAFGVWDGENFYTGNIVVEVNERAQFGNFAYVPRSDGSLMFLKVGS